MNDYSMDLTPVTLTRFETDSSSSISSSEGVRSPQEAEHVSLSAIQSALKNRIAALRSQ